MSTPTTYPAGMNSFPVFAQHYLAAALQLSDEELGANASATKLAPSTRAKVLAECAAFVAAHSADINGQDEQAGTDFFLTRNGHGAGFWDRENIYGEAQAERLSAAASATGTAEFYRGDNGLIYQYGAETFAAPIIPTLYARKHVTPAGPETTLYRDEAGTVVASIIPASQRQPRTGQASVMHNCAKHPLTWIAPDRDPVGAVRPYGDFYTPDMIQEHNRATAYFHSLGTDDILNSLRKVYGSAAKIPAPLLASTNLLHRNCNLFGEIWATSSRHPYTKKAQYTRIK